MFLSFSCWCLCIPVTEETERHQGLPSIPRSQLYHGCLLDFLYPQTCTGLCAYFSTSFIDLLKLHPISIIKTGKVKQVKVWRSLQGCTPLPQNSTVPYQD